MRKKTIPLGEVELAVEAGWEVYAYSEYDDHGVPRCAEIRKPDEEQLKLVNQ